MPILSRPGCRRCRLIVVAYAASCMLMSAAAQAQAPAPAPEKTAADPVAELRREIEDLKQTYQERLNALEKRLTDLETGRQTAAAPPPEAPAPAAPPPAPAIPEVAQAPAPAAEPSTAGGGGGQTSNYFNPSISVIGNFLSVAGQNRVENLPSAELRESELGIQAIVDPYARADFFLSFGEEGVAVEEGFATFTSLPAGLLVKVGRMRSFFGKTNTLHLHVLPWPDEPLNVVDLLGGEEGWIGTGVSVARLVPLPADTFSEATLQVFRGDGGVFTVRKRGDLAYNGHYRVFRDLTEAVNLDAGLSYADGPNDSEPDARTRLQALDATLRWKPLQTATYRSATFRGELFRSRREQPGGTPTAWGGFISGDYQLAKRWFVGARLEQSEHPDDPAQKDRGVAGLLTFWPSEFSQLRAELRRRRYSLRDSSEYTATELLLQLQFAIGAHGAHPF
jgi:hypothetical protein